jgi:GT2 family glycosyltransferase
MRYIIAAPPYSRRSAGIVVLYELQKWLIRLGKDAMILNFKVPYQIEEDDIVIYPEIVSGNPLKAKRVVRYILNEPGRIAGDKDFDKSEILVAYDPYLARYSNGVFLTTPIVEDFFLNRGGVRNIDCLWIGKGKNTNHPITENCVEITYSWPAKRRELAELLNRTATLYSYDDRTMLLTEAALCGCKVVLIKDNELMDPNLQPYDLDAFKIKLKEFIKLTWYPEIDPGGAAREIDKHLSRGRSKHPEPALASPSPKISSIVILTLNQLKYTKACVESIQRNTQEPHEIIFVDNGSSDGTIKWLQRLVKENAHYRMILNNNNLGFARGCNQGIRLAKGEYILLLNNDVVVTKKWLKRMITCAEAIPRSGMVGPMSNFVSGPQLVKPVNYDTASLSGLEAFAETHASKHQGRAIPFWRVVGFCMLIKRAVIERIGGFDERYGQGNFEDDDLTLRAILAGFESWITLDCFVHHYGNRTFAGAGIDYAKSLNGNWAIYKRKWGIPEETAYGSTYNLKEVLSRGFNRIKHYFPLEPQDSDLTTGEELYAIGDVEGARIAFERLVRCNPHNAGALNNLGVIAFREGATDDARDYFIKVLEIDPNHFESAENLGNCMVALKAYEKAVQWFEKALRLKPDDATVLNSLANCFMQMEDFKKAQEAYTKSYQLNNNQPKVGEVLANLEALKTFKTERRASL